MITDPLEPDALDAAAQLVLANTLVAGVLAALAVLATRTRLGAPVAHGLFVLALLKLVTPPLFPVEVPLGLPALTAATPAPAAPAPAAPIPQDLDAVDVAQLELWLAETAPGRTVVLPDDLAPVAAAPTDWRAWLLGAWALGAAGLLLLTLWRAARFHVSLDRARRAEPGLRRELAALARCMGARRTPELLVMPGRLSPMLWGFFGRARIVLPESLLARLSPEQRSTLLAHELAHFCRRDHWVRVLELCARTLHWWNPLVWWVCTRLRQAEEECCDAWVARTLPGSSRCYADALIDTVEYLSGTTRSLPAPASGVGHVKDLKNRLNNIMIDQHPSILSRPRRAAVLLLAAVALPLVPAPGQERRNADEARVRAEDRARRAEERARAAAERAHEHELRRRTAEEGRRGPQDGDRARTLAALERAVKLLHESKKHDDATALMQLLHRLEQESRGRARDRRPDLEERTRQMVAINRQMSDVANHMEKVAAELERARAEGRADQAQELQRKLEELHKHRDQMHQHVDRMRAQQHDMRAHAERLHAESLEQRERGGRDAGDRVQRLEQQVQRLSQLVEKLVHERAHRREHEEEHESEAEEAKAEKKAAEEARRGDRSARRRDRDAARKEADRLREEARREAQRPSRGR